MDTDQLLADAGCRAFVRHEFIQILKENHGKDVDIDKMVKHINSTILSKFSKIAVDETSKVMSELKDKLKKEDGDTN